MINFDDDVYAHTMYSCTACEQKEYLLKEAAGEVTQMMEKFSVMNKIYTDTEQKLMDNLENVCHMLGIPFQGNL